MKAIISILLVLFICATSCTQSSVQSSEIVVSENLSSKTRDFSLKYWQSLQIFENKDENYFTSPLGLHIALGMLLNGANGDTQKELQKVLGFENENINEVNAFYAELIEKLPTTDPKVTNLIANAIWQEKTFGVEKTFTDILAKHFSAKLYNEDFKAATTVDKINKWASDNTNAKITKILDQISPDQVMFLMNALYFKGDWTEQFDTKATSKDIFNGTLNKKSVDFMNKTAEIKYLETADLKIVELPYGNEKYVMKVLLPKSGTVESMISKLSNSLLLDLELKSKKTKIVFQLPKFKIENSLKLIKPLQNMGLKKVFEDAADLSGITKPAGKIKVGSVTQNTYINVDEKGTEAAAVTTIGIVVTSVPVYPEMICNKPFAFIISEKTSNTIMFVGKVANL